MAKAAITVKEYSQAAINKAVREIGLYGLGTLLPIVAGVSVAWIAWLFNLAFLFWFASVAVIGIIFACVNLFIRKHTVANKYIRKLQQEMLRQQEQVKKDLAKGLKECSEISGCAELADQGARQFKSMEEKYDNVHELLQQKLDSGELTFGRFLGAAEKVYLNTLNNLNQVVATLKSAGTINVEHIKGQLDRTNGKEVNTLKERLQLHDDQLADVRDLLAQNEESMTQMEVTSMSVAKMSTGHRFTDVDHDRAMQELTEWAERADSY